MAGISSWYFPRKEIEESSPSRRDGISLKKETSLRKAYCLFLQELGMQLKIPQITIATAIVFCHRVFTRQSHAKNDSKTIATVCLFLAGKVEESLMRLQTIICVSYGMVHKDDPSAAQRIKQKEVYEQQKALILLGERLVLATVGFDLSVQLPYGPLVTTTKKFKVADNSLRRVAWNFVNDGLCTSLCLQYKAQHIAAGAIFLSAKFLKVKIPSNAEKPWWHELDVTACQLEDISNQMMELYGRSCLVASGVAASTNGGTNHSKIMYSNARGNDTAANSSSHAMGHVMKGAHVPDDTNNQSNEKMGADSVSGVQDQTVDDNGKECFLSKIESFSCSREKAKEALNCFVGDAALNEKGENTEAKEWKNEGLFCATDEKCKQSELQL